MPARVPPAMAGWQAPSRFGRRLAVLSLVGALAGCGAAPEVPVTSLPVDPAAGFADPTRQAIIHTAHVFPGPAPLHGRPAEAAQAISEAEHLAVELRWSARWIEMSPLAVMAFEQARPEWRGVLGIAPDAEPQAVIDAMSRVRLALAAHDQAAAAAALQPPLVRPGGAACLALLAALPPLPRTGQAASLAFQGMMRMQRQDRRIGFWP